jgi:hypothetical protein
MTNIIGTSKNRDNNILIQINENYLDLYFLQGGIGKCLSGKVVLLQVVLKSLLLDPQANDSAQEMSSR